MQILFVSVGAIFWAGCLSELLSFLPVVYVPGLGEGSGSCHSYSFLWGKLAWFLLLFFCFLSVWLESPWWGQGREGRCGPPSSTGEEMRRAVKADMLPGFLESFPIAHSPLSFGMLT